MAKALSPILRKLLYCSVLGVLAGPVGCALTPRQDLAPLPEPVATGIVIRRVNANNERIEGVYLARCSLRGRVVDDQGRRHAVDLSGPLVCDPPRELRLDLRHTLKGPVLFVGSNPERYWMRLTADIKRLWFGRYGELARGDAKALPIHPEQLVDALGIGLLPGERSGFEGPVRLASADGEQDILIYLQQDEVRGLLHAREYHIDRRPPFLIRRVVVRDGLGQALMEAELDRYEPIEETGPLTAKSIALSWPDQGTELELKLSGRKLRDWDDARRQRGFGFPSDPMVPAENIVDLDAVGRGGT